MILELLAKALSARDLADPPPADPMPWLVAWHDDAARSGHYADPNAMTLATVGPDGAPSARVVLCKAIDPAAGALTFYTNYTSRKGRELAADPRAACVFHWPHAQRQARVEGVVERLSDAESDAYFASRPLLSRIGACVSPQSQPISSRAELLTQAMDLARTVGVTGTIKRPPQWGGYRLLARVVELWSGHEGRLHQRVRWTGAPGAWHAELLAP